MSGLRIARGLTLPVEVAGEAIAILAKRGAGKTNTARVLVEEIHGAGIQLVVLDPVSAWWGLRSSADGQEPGLPIAVIGGAFGDVALEATAGKLLADVVVDSGQSIVLDLSDFSKTQQRSFVAEFAERLYLRKARERHPLHVVLEEADEFAPQRVRANEAAMVGAIDKLVRRGRSRGIGITMVTQRSAVLNKDVLEQTDVLIAMRTTGPNDRKAITGWVDVKADDGADVVSTLPALATGEAWVWNPERDLLDRVRIRLAHTYDSGATPKAGEKRTAPKEVAPIDLTALGAEIQATAERAKENDPAELRRRIRELERAAAAKPEPEARVETVVEVPVLTEEERYALSKFEVLGEVAVEQWREDAAALEALVGRIHETLATAARAGGTERAATAVQPRAARPRVEAVRRVPDRPPAPAAGHPSVSGPQQRILDALAALELIGVATPARTQVALFAQASPKSSAFANNLGALRNDKGTYDWPPLIDYPPGIRVCLTSDGRAAARADAAPASVAELHAYVAKLVGGAKWRLLEQLIAAYPDALSKQELADRAGASATSSAFANNLGSLRSLGLIDYPQGGYVAALPVLFMEGT